MYEIRISRFLRLFREKVGIAMGILGKRDTTDEGEEASMDGFEGQMAVPVCILSTWDPAIKMRNNSSFWRTT